MNIVESWKKVLQLLQQQQQLSAQYEQQQEPETIFTLARMNQLDRELGTYLHDMLNGRFDAEVDCWQVVETMQVSSTAVPISTTIC